MSSKQIAAYVCLGPNEVIAPSSFALGMHNTTRLPMQD